MRTIEEIRQLRLLQLLEQPEFPTVKALATAIERTQSQVSQWKARTKRAGSGHYHIESATARHIEACTNKVRGWMDHDPAYDDPKSAVPVQVFSPMGATVAGWLDGMPEARRLKAFWIIHQMVFADDWPADVAKPVATAPTEV
jgi:hypothetical protein